MTACFSLAGALTRSDVIGRLESLQPSLEGYGIASLYLYGSYARDEARSDSDIDILADFAADRPPDFSRFMGAYHRLQDAFPGREIGFNTRDSLVPLYRPFVEDGAIRVF